MSARSRRRLKQGVLVLAALFLGAQFVPVDTANPPVQSAVSAPAAVHAILVEACFDCHSHETRWPWYSRIAPVSWWTAGHVSEGRRDLNFSRWPAYDFTAQALILREIDQQVSTGSMPPWSYRLGHPKARLSAEKRQELLDWTRVGMEAEADIW